MIGAVEREASEERSGYGDGRIDSGGGTNVAVLHKGLGPLCSVLRKEVPCLVTDSYRGGTA